MSLNDILVFSSSKNLWFTIYWTVKFVDLLKRLTQFLLPFLFANSFTAEQLMKDKTKLSETFKTFVFYQQELVNTQVFAYGLMLLILKNLLLFSWQEQRNSKLNENEQKNFLQLKPATVKVTLLHGSFPRFLNCKQNSTKCLNFAQMTCKLIFTPYTKDCFKNAEIII